jgi:hypothetical protein
MTKFKLEIDLGNDEMRTGEHIAQALRNVAVALEELPGRPEPEETTGIYDINGNTVGYWKFED